jgi:RimJ/RimL family protein N-acetyltransferase
MYLQKFGITLRRLQKNDIELVRQKRNSEDISRFMMYREHITQEMQLNWFNTINNTNNFYFIIEYLGEKIGLVNDKNIDWNKKTSEGGLFIWEERFRNSMIPLLVSVCIIEMAFYVLNWEKSEVVVLKSNKQAIDYNLSLGFIIQNAADSNIIKMVLTRENYEVKAKKLTEAALILNQGNSDMILTLEPQDFNSGLAIFIENLLEKSPVRLEQKTEGKNKIFIHRHLS